MVRLVDTFSQRVKMNSSIDKEWPPKIDYTRGYAIDNWLSCSL